MVSSADQESIPCDASGRYKGQENYQDHMPCADFPNFLSIFIYITLLSSRKTDRFHHPKPSSFSLVSWRNLEHHVPGVQNENGNFDQTGKSIFPLTVDDVYATISHHHCAHKQISIQKCQRTILCVKNDVERDQRESYFIFHHQSYHIVSLIIPYAVQIAVDVLV